VARDIARLRGIEPGQVALAWVQQQADVWGVAVVPIPGTSKLAHLDENVAALQVERDPEELARVTTPSTGLRIECVCAPPRSPTLQCVQRSIRRESMAPCMCIQLGIVRTRTCRLEGLPFGVDPAHSKLRRDGYRNPRA
jgi:hypothetical protein